MGLAVIAAIPKAPGEAPVAETIDPWSIKAPDGLTYQWVRSHLLGEPDPETVEKRLGNGWVCVEPEAHPGAPVSNVEQAVASGGLILMAKPTVEVERSLAVALAEREAHWAAQGFHFHQKVIKETEAV